MASPVLSQAYIVIRPDVNRFGSDLSSGLKKEQGRLRSLGAGMAKSLAVGFAAASAGAIAFSTKAVSAASDFNETISKSAVIFGEEALPALRKFADQAATSMGQSKQQALDAATTFAVFGKSAGLSGDNLVNFSTKFTRLASDMASFSNTTPEEAIQAIGSALRGEAEPMRRYGVLLDDASLRQEALAQGLIKTTKEALTPQQKVLAAQALIFKQTKDAQGDFARTSDGLANQQRILAARFEDVKVKVGTVLLPIVLKFVTVLNNNFLPAIDKVGSIFKSLRPAFDAIRAKVAALLPTLESLRPAFETVRSAVEGILPSFRRIGSDGPSHFAKIKTAVTSVVSAFQGLAQAVAPIISRFVLLVQEKWGAIEPWARDTFNQVASIVRDAFQLIATQIKFATKIISFIWKHFGEDIIRVIVNVFAALGGIISGALMVVRGIIKTITSIIKGDWKGAWTGIKLILAGIWKAIWAVLKFALNQMKIVTNIALTAIRLLIKTIWNKILDNIRGTLNKIKDTLSDAWTFIRNKAKDAWNAVWNAIKDVWNSIIQGIKSRLSDVKGILNDAWSSIRTSAKTKWDAVWSAIKGVWDGIVSGIRTRIGNVKDIVSSAWTDIKNKTTSVWNAIKDFFPGFFRKVQGGFASAVRGIRKIWKGLEGAAAGPVRFVVNTVWNKGIQEVLSKIPGIPHPGDVSFAEGGPVKGGRRGKDSVLSWLMPGEHVLTAYEVMKAGGHAVIMRLRQALRLGRAKEWDPPAFAGGGTFTPAQMAAAQSFARAQVGKPYALGGVGPGAYDCSGFMAAIANVLQGKYPYSRRGSTATFPWPGFAPGHGQFTIGSAYPFPGSSMGHMAGTLGGMPVESYGGHGPSVSHRNASSPGFNEIYHLGGKGAGGGFSLIAIIKKLWNLFKEIKKWISELGSMKGWGGVMRDMVKHTASDLKNWLKDEIPGFGHGGIVTRPTLARIGEVPEMIVPLSRFKSSVPRAQLVRVVSGKLEIVSGRHGGLEGIIRGMVLEEIQDDADWKARRP